MEHTHALTLFSLAEGESPQEKYDEEIFRFKQYFVSKPIVPKLYFKKSSELLLLHEAAIELYPEIEAGVFLEKENLDIVYSGNWKPDYNSLQLARTHFKQKMMNATGAPTIAQVVTEWVEIEIKYIKKYSEVFSGDEFQPVIVSKESDPMVLLTEINKLEIDDSIQNLTLCRKELSELLQNELKRLNLLTQYLQ